jgi:hypothetical protein
MDLRIGINGLQRILKIKYATQTKCNLIAANNRNASA